MRITRAVATNFKGFASFDETFGDVTVFSGRNAEGKSTALDILCAAFVTDGSRDLLRTGAEEGEIRVYLEDDGSTFEVRRTLKPGKVSEAKIKCDRKGREPGAAAAFLREIVDTATLDPIRQVMAATPKEQMRILLETMPLDMDPGPVAEATADLVPKLNLVNGRANLDTIKAAYDSIYEERTLLNRDAKTKVAHAEELRASVKDWAAPEGRSWQAAYLEVDRQLQELIAADESSRRAADLARSTAVADGISRKTAAQSEIDREIDAKMRDLERERGQRQLAVTAQWAEELKRLDESYALTIEGLVGGSQEERERLTAEKTKAQQLASGEAQVKRTLTIAGDAERGAEAAKAAAAKMTAALKRLDGVRDQLLAKLPIKGLKVEGGAATLNGVSLGELNTAEQAKFWIRVAVLRAMSKDLGVVVIDHAECFDDVNLPLVIEACRESGLQFFIGRVAPHDFSIQRFESLVTA